MPPPDGMQRMDTGHIDLNYPKPVVCSEGGVFWMFGCSSVVHVLRTVIEASYCADLYIPLDSAQPYGSGIFVMPPPNFRAQSSGRSWGERGEGACCVRRISERPAEQKWHQDRTEPGRRE